MHFVEPRPHYRPSGRFHWRRLAVATALLLALASAVALGYVIQLSIGFYALVLSVFLPLLALAGGLHWAVRSAHLRNPLLATALGAACAAAAYLGYFHLDHCLRWQGSLPALHELPAYITFRMETDRWQWHDKGASLIPLAPAPGVVPQRPLAQAIFQSLNWGVFACELLLLIGGAAGTALATARRPYSESRGTWFDMTKLSLAPDDGKSLEQALRERTLVDWVAAEPRLVPEHVPHTYIYLWYVPGGAGQETDADAYIAVGEGPWLLLEPDEIAALVPLFPGLQEIAASQDDVAQEAEQSSDPGTARIWKVSPPYAGQVQNNKTRFRWRLMVQSALLAPLLLVPGLIAASVGLAWLVTCQLLWLPEWFMVVAVVASCGAGLLVVRYWYDPHRPVWMAIGRRYNQGLLRKAIASRPDPLVAASDPAAITAEMCPRRIWLTGGNYPCQDSNIGLMLLDHDRRALIFEGDYERYWIPAAAMLDARIERIPIGQPTTASMYGVVLHIRLATRAWELPFFPLEGVPGYSRWDRAATLLAQIEELCLRSFADEQSTPPEPAPAGAHAV